MISSRRLSFVLILMVLLGVGGVVLMTVGKGRVGTKGHDGRESPDTTGDKPMTAQSPPRATPSGDSSVSQTASTSTTGQTSVDQAKTGGGVTAATTTSAAASKPADVKNDQDYGASPPVSAQANESIRSVAEALKSKSHPERLTPLVPPKPYDDTAFEKDKASYCNTVEPGRAFQSAQPGEGVPRLEMLSNQLQNVVQGEQVALQVQGVAGKPVTFVAFDGGRFDNQLNTITVVADDQGTATVHYQATTGVINEVNIQAASPVASGQAKFTVYVSKSSEGTKP